MRRRWQRVPREVRYEILGLARQGLAATQIAVRADASVGTVYNVLGTAGYPRLVVRSTHRLSVEDRVEIRLGLERGWSYRRIGERIGRAASTVCREVNRNGGRHAYLPLTADHVGWQRARRPKAGKLSCHPQLRTRVTADLQALWSPKQIAQRLRLEFGDDPTMTVSHETIYRSLYVQGRGELRRELTRCLRTGRARRRRQGTVDNRGQIPGMIMISQRPPEIADRAVPGHWEGDLLLGRDGKSQIGTLVERSTRFVMLLHLPKQRTAEAVREAMTGTILTLPQALRRSITWDQGREMAQHRQFTIDTGVDIYFCDPHSPWQRGSNENTNGLLRQYFPKSTSLRRYTPTDLQAVADSLNGRPRQTLGWMTPSEKLAELLR
ncbi:MAG: IS30 family transposase [Actinobacteria bacterium]|nr:IS30 family transposase [Actinomycetota bacterium]